MQKPGYGIDYHIRVLEISSRKKTHVYIYARTSAVHSMIGSPVRSCLCKQPSRKIFAQDNSGPHYRGGWSFSLRDDGCPGARGGASKEHVGKTRMRKTEKERDEERKGGRREIDSTCIN